MTMQMPYRTESVLQYCGSVRKLTDSTVIQWNGGTRVKLNALESSFFK